MSSKINWQSLLATALLAVALLHIVRTDYQSLQWAERLSSDGSAAPALDVNSSTGYEGGLRHFIGTRARGETFRWIAYTQDLASKGFFQAEQYSSDTIPTGRPQLLPKLYAAWLLLIAAALHLFGAASFPLAIEQAALWEPIISHLLIFSGFSLWVARRFSLPYAALAGWFFVLFPYISAQFIPGSLSADTWALFLAVFALSLAFPQKDLSANPIQARTAALASFSLWLNPAFGVPAVLILAGLGFITLLQDRSPLRFFSWALLGAGIIFFAWLIDQNPWSPAASELRYIHPLYSIAWLGIGLTLNGIQGKRLNTGKPAFNITQIATGGLMIGSLAFVQISEGFPAWLYSGASLLRPSSLDETQVFANAFQWIRNATAAESLFLIVLPVAALAVTIYELSKSNRTLRTASLSTLVILLSVLILAFLKIRWGVTLCLLSIPVLWNRIALLHLEHQRYAMLALAPLLFAFFAWGKQLPPNLQRPSDDDTPANADLEALVYRHAAHWMATHYPSRPVKALASPELSDSLIFHGNSQTLMSTAWESYPGQIAASRILSAPEDSEVQALLESRELTHLLLPSWDKVIPLLVQSPNDANVSNYYERIQRWILPLFLRAMPYHMPSTPGFESEKLVVFEMTPAQDDALSLSRLAEYFVEMRRSEPAALAGKSLGESYPDDPNAQIAQTFVYADAENTLGIRKQLTELVADAEAGLVPLDWDRRVLRAIALALGKRHQLAKPEIQACLDTISEDGIYGLTPLQTFQFLKLIALYELELPNNELRTLLLSRCSEYIPQKGR